MPATVVLVRGEVESPWIGERRGLGGGILIDAEGVLFLAALTVDRSFVLLEHDPLQPLSRLWMNRMGDVLERAIGSPAIRHSDEQPLVAANHFEAPDYDGVVQGDADERPKLIIVMQHDAGIGDPHSCHLRVLTTTVASWPVGRCKKRDRKAREQEQENAHPCWRAPLVSVIWCEPF